MSALLSANLSMDLESDSFVRGVCRPVNNNTYIKN